MIVLRRACALTLIFGLGLSQSASLAMAVGGAVVGVTGAAIGGVAKGTGMVVGAVLPGGGKDKDRR